MPSEASKDDSVQIAVGCFDGSLHVLEVDLENSASSSFSVVFSSGGEAGGSSGDGVEAGGSSGDGGSSVAAGGDGEFSTF